MPCWHRRLLWALQLTASSAPSCALLTSALPSRRYVSSFRPNCVYLRLTMKQAIRRTHNGICGRPLLIMTLLFVHANPTMQASRSRICSAMPRSNQAHHDGYADPFVVRHSNLIASEGKENGDGREREFVYIRNIKAHFDRLVLLGYGVRCLCIIYHGWLEFSGFEKSLRCIHLAGPICGPCLTQVCSSIMLSEPFGKGSILVAGRCLWWHGRAAWTWSRMLSLDQDLSISEANSRFFRS